MRCDRQVLVWVFIPSVFAAPIGQTFFKPAQLRHKHEIETETETTTQTYTEVEPQTETVYVTEVYTEVHEEISGSLPTSSIEPTRSDPEPKETRSLAPIALPNPPDDKFSSDNGKFLGLFLAVIGVVALLATVFFMLHRYRALHKRTTTSKTMVASSSSLTSDKSISDSHKEYLGGEELDRKQTSITLLDGDSGDKSRSRIVGSSEGLQQTRVKSPSLLEGQPPVALVGNGRITGSPRIPSMIGLPPSVFKRASSPSPLRNMWQARSGFHAPVIRIPVTQSVSNMRDQEQYDVRCRKCEKMWLARPLSREWPKSP